MKNGSSHNDCRMKNELEKILRMINAIILKINCPGYKKG